MFSYSSVFSGRKRQIRVDETPNRGNFFSVFKFSGNMWVLICLPTILLLIVINCTRDMAFAAVTCAVDAYVRSRTAHAMHGTCYGNVWVCSLIIIYLSGLLARCQNAWSQVSGNMRVISNEINH